jgi:hypothetical protein
MKASGWQIGLAAFGLLSACEVTSDPVAAKNPRYYDVAGFLEQTISELEKTPATLFKTITDRSVGTQTTRLDKPNWKTELEPFRDAELNRPAWRNAFDIDSVKESDGSQIITYRKRDGQKVPLNEAILTLNSERKLLRMVLVLEDNNMLFYTLKRLDLEVMPGSHPALKQYSISGVQKMIASDSVNYKVRGVVSRAAF